MNQHETALDEMACQELVEVLTDYLEGALPAQDVRRLEAHLADCPPCQTYIEQMRLTLRAVGRLSSDELAPETRSQLVQAFRSWRRGLPD
jgi:anti-sigma factor RsiW